MVVNQDPVIPSIYNIYISVLIDSNVTWLVQFSCTITWCSKHLEQFSVPAETLHCIVKPICHENGLIHGIDRDSPRIIQLSGGGSKFTPSVYVFALAGEALNSMVLAINYP